MPQQHYPQEAEAKQAAKQAGLTEEQFEVVSGPKGFTYRKRKLYKKVDNAKLHVGKDPEAKVEPIHTEVPGHPHIFRENATDRFRYSDETEAFSQESFETIETAEAALARYVSWLNNGEGTWTGRLDSSHPHYSNLPKEDLPIKLEKRMCPNCEESVDTYISGETLRYIEHPFGSEDGSVCNMSEEIVVNVPITGAPHSEFKTHELAQIENGVTEPSNGQTPHLHKSLIPNPSKTVWIVADEMIIENPSVTRKQVIERCLKMNIAFFTARTQYQQWKKAREESIDHAAHAPHIKID